MFTRDIVIASVVFSLLVAAPGRRPQLAAQGQTPGTTGQSSPTPVFRSGAEAIQVDVTVTDGDGRLISDLMAEDYPIVLAKPLERVPEEHGLLEGFRMWVTLPLADLSAGLYALQVHGRSGQDEDRRDTRSLLIRVK